MVGYVVLFYQKVGRDISLAELTWIAPLQTSRERVRRAEDRFQEERFVVFFLCFFGNRGRGGVAKKQHAVLFRIHAFILLILGSAPSFVSF